ncbi:MAG TPA: rRNA maturation RNase YbeY [Anaerolineae bacterium]
MTPTNPSPARIAIRARNIYRPHGRAHWLRAAARAALAQTQPRGACTWTIRLTDDDELHELNRQFRGMDKPTDVLSFGGAGYRDGKPNAAYTPILDEGAEYLGDIIISLDRCTAQAAAGGHAVDTELALLVVHGTLHLLGYDHDTPSRKARMWAAQSRALAALGIELAVP